MSLRSSLGLWAPLVQVLASCFHRLADTLDTIVEQSRDRPPSPLLPISRPRAPLLVSPVTPPPPRFREMQKPAEFLQYNAVDFPYTSYGAGNDIKFTVHCPNDFCRELWMSSRKKTAAHMAYEHYGSCRVV